ncbi:MAG: type I-E CRISPR-associated protein Cse2/CasB [Succinivibrionaceae bacterium]|nr:type I-E CRISPR-associated protein Cse2/CasB [Succinivibrionaceae bacterium]
MDRITHRARRFVPYICGICAQSPEAAAALRRADQPQINIAAIRIITDFGIPTYSRDYHIYSFIAAALARGRVRENGSLTIPHALWLCEQDSRIGELEAIDPRLARLICCTGTDQDIRTLRPIVRLLQCRHSEPLDYADLTCDLHRASYPRLRDSVRQKWIGEYLRWSHAA